jgi:hypothetical protein
MGNCCTRTIEEEQLLGYGRTTFREYLQTGEEWKPLRKGENPSKKLEERLNILTILLNKVGKT